MNKLIKIFFVICLLFLSTAIVRAEQFVMVCKLNVSAVNYLTNETIRTYVIDRYFIVDTVLQGVYDANNLPLDVNEFTERRLTFSKKAVSYTDIVDTRITYDRTTRKITLNEIYAYASKYDQRAKFVTKGEGSCTEIKINRKPLF